MLYLCVLISGALGRQTVMGLTDSISGHCIVAYIHCQFILTNLTSLRVHLKLRKEKKQHGGGGGKGNWNDLEDGSRD